MVAEGDRALWRILAVSAMRSLVAQAFGITLLIYRACAAIVARVCAARRARLFASIARKSMHTLAGHVARCSKVAQTVVLAVECWTFRAQVLTSVTERAGRTATLSVSKIIFIAEAAVKTIVAIAVEEFGSWRVAIERASWTRALGRAIERDVAFAGALAKVFMAWIIAETRFGVVYNLTRVVDWTIVY